MFDDEIFLSSINKAKWNIYVVSLQDLTFYTLSYLKVFHNYNGEHHAEEIYEDILNLELNKLADRIKKKNPNVDLSASKNENKLLVCLDI